MFKHLLQGQGHEMVKLLIHSRILIFIYVKCSFLLVSPKTENQATYTEVKQAIVNRRRRMCGEFGIGFYLMKQKTELC